MFKKNICFFLFIRFFFINNINNLYGQRYSLKIIVPETKFDINFMKLCNHKNLLNKSLKDLISLKSTLFKLDDVDNKNAFNLLKAIIEHKDKDKKIENFLQEKGSLGKMQLGAEKAIDAVIGLADEIPKVIEKQVDKTMGVQNALKKVSETAQEFIKKCSHFFMDDIPLNKKIAFFLGAMSTFFFYRLLVNYLKKHKGSDELKKSIDTDFLRYLNQEQFTGPIIEALKLDRYKTIYNSLSLDWNKKLNVDCASIMNSNRMINLWGSFGGLFLSGGAFFYKEIYFGFLYLLKLTIYKYKLREQNHHEERAIIEADLNRKLNELNNELEEIKIAQNDYIEKRNEIQDKIRKNKSDNDDLAKEKEEIFQKTKNIKQDVTKINKDKVNKIKKHISSFFNTKIDKIVAFDIKVEDINSYDNKFNNLLKCIREKDSDLVSDFKDVSNRIIELINLTYNLQNQYNNLTKESTDLDKKWQKLTVEIISLRDKLKESCEQNAIEKEKIKKLLAQINQNSEVSKELLSRVPSKQLAEIPKSYEEFEKNIPKEEDFDSSSKIKDLSLNNIDNKEQKIEDRMQKLKYKNLFFNTKQLSVLISFPFFIWIVLKYTKHDQVIIDFFNECGKDFKQQINKFFSFIYDNIVSALKESHEFLKPAVTPLICVGSLLTCYLFFMHYVKKYTIDGLTEDLCEGENKRLLGFIAYVKKKLDESDNKEADKKASKIKGIQGGIKEEQEIDFSGLGYARLIELYYNKLDFVFIDELCPDTIFNIEKDYDKKLFQFLMHCKKIYYDIIQSKNKQSTALKDIKSIISLIPSLSTLQSRNKIDSLSHFRNRPDLNIMDFIEDLQTVAYNKKYGDLKSILDRLKKYIKDKKHEEEEEEAQLAEYCESESFYSISNNSELSSSEKSHSKRVFFRVD